MRQGLVAAISAAALVGDTDCDAADEKDFMLFSLDTTGEALLTVTVQKQNPSVTCHQKMSLSLMTSYW